MSTIVTINASDLISNSRADINSNFAALNTDKIETSVIDTDTALTANSDAKIPSQKAVKTYIDTQGGANARENVRGIVEEASDAEVTAGTATGGTGAKLFVSPTKLATILATYSKTRLFANGLTTKLSTDASTTQNIAHGLGIAPKAVRFSVHYASNPQIVVGQGVYQAGGQNTVISGSGTGAFSRTSSSAALLLAVDSSSNIQTGTVSVDATNIIITWVKGGTPGSTTFNILWDAEA